MYNESSDTTSVITKDRSTKKYTEFKTRLLRITKEPGHRDFLAIHDALPSCVWCRTVLTYL